MNIPKGLQRYLTNTAWLFIERVVRLGIAFVVSIYVARYLGPLQFGMLSYAISFVSIFTVLANLGLQPILVRELVNRKDSSNELLGSVFVLKLSGALSMLILFAILVPIVSETPLETVLIFIVAASVVFQTFNVIDFYYQAEVRSKYSVQVRVIALLFSSAMKLVLIIIHASLLYFAVALALESFITAAGFVSIYHHHHKSIFHWKYCWSSAKALLRDSWPLIISGIAISIYLKIDQVMIKNMIGASAVGSYAVAVRISESLYFISLIVVNSLFPAIINAKKKNDRIYKKRLQQLYDVLVWLGIGLSIILSISAEWIITLLYGDKFPGAGPVLRIHVWALVFVYMGQAASRWFLAENKQRQLTVMHALGSIINVGLNIFAIPKYGIQGAAWTTVLSYACSSYFSILIFPNCWITFKMLSSSLNPLGALRRYHVHYINLNKRLKEK